MPDPSNYKTQSEWMSACVPTMVKEGRPKAQAVAACINIWKKRVENGAVEDPSMGTEDERDRQDELSRTQRVANVDPDNGTFGMTIASEGEASDGHILSVEGGVLPERMPMLLSHWNEPTKAVGSIVRMRRHLSEAPRRITAIGMLEMEGEGAGVEMRRDLMHMIARGHVNAVSIKWDFDWKNAIPRTKLPPDHSAYVDGEREAYNSPKRGGYYFQKWRAREGSIVGVGADAKALIGRSRDTDGEVSAFWARMAQEAQDTPAEAPPERNILPDVHGLVATFGSRVRELAGEVEHLTKLGIPFDELMRIFEENKPIAPVGETLTRLMAKVDSLERQLQERNSREVGVPAAPDSLTTVVRRAVDEIRAERRAQFEEFRRDIAARKGKVPPNGKTSKE